MHSDGCDKGSDERVQGAMKAFNGKTWPSGAGRLQGGQERSGPHYS